MATTKAKNTTPKALPEGGKPRSKAELAAELVRVLPGALKGPEDTPERLAKRCTVAELERMLTEARTPLPQTDLGFASDPAPDALMGALADDRAARQELEQRSDQVLADALAAQPEWLKVGARVHVKEVPGEDPAFYGVVTEGVQEGQVCVRGEDGAAFWVDVEDVTLDTRPAQTVATVIKGPDDRNGAAEAARQETLPEGTPGVAGVDDLLALVKQEGIDWEAMASDEARAEEEAAMAKKAREEARRAQKATASPSPTTAQRTLPPVGTTLKHGDQTAKVVPGGVEFDGKVYGSISAAAKAASVAAGLGDKVSGWVYWGLKKKESRSGTVRAPKPTAAQAQLELARNLWRAILDEKHEGEEWTDGYLTGAVCALARFLGVTTEALKGGETPAPAPATPPAEG